MDNKFPCTGCGCCCKRIDKVIENLETLDDISKEILHFPYNHTNGICEKLDKDNKCSIYDDRPIVCNFQKFKEIFNYDVDKFNAIVIPSCNKMMDEDNIPEEFRILY